MAIAYDAGAGSAVGSGSSLTFSHTCTGSDRALYVGFWVVSTGDVATGVTYNGVSLTKIKGNVAIQSNAKLYLYGLLNPATGANNIVISLSTATEIYAASASYTGVSQTTLYDDVDSNAATTTSLTVTTTVSTDNSWLIGTGGSTSAGTNVGASTTEREGSSASDETIMADSGGAKSPTGDYSLIFTRSATANIGGIVAAVPLAVAASGPAKLKTRDTIAKASVKTIDTIAIASVKTIDTIGS